VEGAGANIMHFTRQLGFRTSLPSIYHPHDLQHVHLPQFFSEEERRWREVTYGGLCRQAALVAVASTWAREDVVAHYQLAEDRVVVVPLAPPTGAYPATSEADFEAVRSRLALPDRFFLYPAQTWPHKNHLGLLQALALLRDRERMRIPVVFPGRQNEHFAVIEAKVAELGIGSQVRFPGFVSPVELVCLYRLATGVVIPTRFEAGSFPLWEAFFLGVPAACSNVTSLPAQAGDAALLFEPEDVEGMAHSIARLWSDQDLRRELAQRGRQRVARFTWGQTARAFRAHYRRLAGKKLSREDLELLLEPPCI